MESVKDVRLDAGLTQDELSERSGVAQPNIAAYESGRRSPSRAMLARIKKAAPPRPSVVIGRKREQIIAIAKQHKAEDLRIFGSAARGSDVSGSDIDLLVRLAPEATVFDLAGLTLDLEEATGLHVDVVSENGLRSGPNPIRDEAVPL